jgi:hypothetical protein
VCSEVVPSPTFARRFIMQPDSRKEKQPAEPRKEVSERKRRFRIVKLEERIAPGGGSHHTRHRGCYR